MQESIQITIREHALRHPHEEVCGAIYHDGTALPIANISPRRHEEFILCPKTLGESYRQSLCGVYHSHPDSPTHAFSSADIEASNKCGLPFMLYSVKQDAFAVYRPLNIRNSKIYLGRKFIYGLNDCYTLVSDFYYHEFGIILRRQVDRIDDSWIKHQQDYYYNEMIKEGFFELQQPFNIKPNDVIMTSLPTYNFPIHAAIVLSDNRVLHHLPNNISRIELFDRQWRQRTKKVLRHVKLQDNNS